MIDYSECLISIAQHKSAAQKAFLEKKWMVSFQEVDFIEKWAVEAKMFALEQRRNEK